ncbi:ARF GTPase-activating protein GIT2 [Chionoecetes opilio]|uniref:ARF GTPase-activating protein GIT2 n=1 Tax=Chionoecetes opilio TaxID=41210 RepID=A0A8J5CHD8_CHIOP|nr:ARF GTPase-activating protein GIT2 [Chionoecetes opilio]
MVLWWWVRRLSHIHRVESWELVCKILKSWFVIGWPEASECSRMAENGGWDNVSSGHPITNQDFNILHTSSHDSTRWICESLLTHHHKPSLCAQGTSTPLGRCPAGVQGALRQLVTSATRLLSECHSYILSHAHSPDPKFVTQTVIQCAYDIAKGAKVLAAYQRLERAKEGGRVAGVLVRVWDKCARSVPPHARQPPPRCTVPAKPVSLILYTGNRNNFTIHRVSFGSRVVAVIHQEGLKQLARWRL